MCNYVLLYLSSNSNDNEIARGFVYKLKDSVKIEETDKIIDMFDPTNAPLPAVVTNSGENYIGVDNVRRFVKKELSLRQ